MLQGRMYHLCLLFLLLYVSTVLDQTGTGSGRTQIEDCLSVFLFQEELGSFRNFTKFCFHVNS